MSSNSHQPSREDRAVAFTRWLVRQIPPRKHRRLAVVNGDGTLAGVLHERGYDVTVFGHYNGPVPEGVGKITRRPLDKQHFRTGDIDAVVGMHCLGRLWHHVPRLAIEAGVPFAMCLAAEGEQDDRTSWLKLAAFGLCALMGYDGQSFSIAHEQTILKGWRVWPQPPGEWHE